MSVRALATFTAPSAETCGAGCPVTLALGNSEPYTSATQRALRRIEAEVNAHPDNANRRVHGALRWRVSARRNEPESGSRVR